MEYQIDVAKRIAEILGQEKIVLTPDMTFSYSFDHGYENLSIGESGKGKGSYHFRGAYHPDAVCVGGGICKYCGKTL